jgi:hypothetical protein
MAVNIITDENNTSNEPQILRMFQGSWESRSKYSLAVHDFLERPYWKRMWIVQEVMVAQRLHFLCGDRGFEERRLMQALLFWLKVRDLEDEHAMVICDSHGLRMITQRAVWGAADSSESTTTTLRGLLMEYREMESTDPLDKIYALLGLIRYSPPRKLKPIPIDYRFSVFDLYAETLRYIYAETQISEESFLETVVALRSCFGLGEVQDPVTLVFLRKKVQLRKYCTNLLSSLGVEKNKPERGLGHSNKGIINWNTFLQWEKEFKEGRTKSFWAGIASSETAGSRSG